MGFKVLDRYVYRQMLPVFVIAVSVFTFLHVMDRLQDFSNMAVNGAPLYLVSQLWALLLLSFVSHTLPMGLLLAVVTTCGRLASDLEVVALHALGVSPLRLFRPFLVAALAVALTVATLTLWINPWGSAAFFQCLRELRQHAAIPMIQEQTFTRIGNIVVYTDEMDLSTSELRGVLIGDERDPKTFGIITAPHGRLIDDEPRRPRCSSSSSTSDYPCRWLLSCSRWSPFPWASGFIGGGEPSRRWAASSFTWCITSPRRPSAA